MKNKIAVAFVIIGFISIGFLFYSISKTAISDNGSDLNKKWKNNTIYSIIAVGVSFGIGSLLTKGYTT